MSENWECFVEDVTFRNADSGFAVLQVRVEGVRVPAVGPAAHISAGDRVKIIGAWARHPDYGRQIRIESAVPIQPSTVSGVEKYLASGVIRGVGEATARLIIDEFGEHALDIIEAHPERLTEVVGIGPKRAKMIAESYAAKNALRTTTVALYSLGITPRLAAKIIKEFGESAHDIAMRNPYLIADTIPGVGFRTADRIARAAGIPADSSQRMLSGVKYVLSEAVEGEGHMYLPRETLIRDAKRLLSAQDQTVEIAIEQLSVGGQIKLQSDADGQPVYYPDYCYYAEVSAAQRLLTLRDNARPMHMQVSEIDRIIAAHEAESHVTLDDSQRAAVHMAVNSGVCVMTGGPGTGKTTTIRCVLRILDALGGVALCAPTGRAGKRMSEATGRDASTIHRLLEYSGDAGAFARNENYPLEADALIVDESSMLDIFLLNSLLRALKPGTRLMFVGDADQLPSVGAGNVLHDIISSAVLPVMHLTRIFRQDDASHIVMNAHLINHGDMPLLNPPGGDFFFEKVDAPDDAANTIVGLIASRLPAFLSVDPMRDIQALSPMKKGETGVWELNRRLQSALNPPEFNKPELSWGDITLRLNDKIMHIKNNYSLKWQCGSEEGVGVFNGDMGIITRIDLPNGLIEVTFDDERIATYAQEMLDELAHAYCISIHKSQGSEFPVVVIPVLPGPRMLLTRSLLYTAVTRAQKCVMLVGRREIIREMISNAQERKRYTGLSDRLKGVHT